MPQFTTLTGTMVPLPVDNIDTDQIIPARFLKVTDKHGLGKVCFCDWRYEGTVETVASAEDAIPRTDFVLNDPTYADAAILVAGDNFGSGSSREHAPWALMGYGFQAVIARSFADIFRNNSLKNGLLPIIVDADTHETLLDLIEEVPGAEITISLPDQTVTLPDGATFEFPIDGFSKKCLLEGIDQLGYLQSFSDEVLAYEEARHVASS